MASSSSSSRSVSNSSSQSWNYDVFLSFRGEDTRGTFVDHLYKALNDRLIHTYRDDVKLPKGESVRPALLKAIEASRHAIIIFSKNYADSSWCLDELVHIMKCRAKNGQIVIPIFYHVDPSDVRKQNGYFGRAFSKQKLKNGKKIEFWRKGLVAASNISGWELKNVANGHEAAVIQEIVEAISYKMLLPNSDVDEELVGMRDRIKDLISRLEIKAGGVRMVGIWGVGGCGKTTLATSVYAEINHRFQGHCTLENIREESSKHGRTTLQAKILSTLLKTRVEVQSEEEGKRLIKSRLCRSNVLILLDDVDDRKQLEALVGSHNWFGDGSRIIITTRNEHLLQRVDYVSPVKLLSCYEASRLFRRHAYNEKDPIKGYNTLSLRVVAYADGLPLALKVLGSFLYDKDEEEWMSALDRLNNIPKSEILEQLKISYDGLEGVEKELFLDIACFFRGEYKKHVVEILDACGFYPDIGIKVLRQKALITIDSEGLFNMHDLIQEMAHYIVRGEHPNKPAKHSRVWKDEEIQNMCLEDTAEENNITEAIRYNIDYTQRFCKIVSNMKKLRWLSVTKYNHDRDIIGPNFLSNELRYIFWEEYPGEFPDSFQPMNLVVLKLKSSLQRELWNGYKALPHLKVLELKWLLNLVRTPDFDGLPCLEKLQICYCNNLLVIHPSLGNHRSLKYLEANYCHRLQIFPTIVQMKKLEVLKIWDCGMTFEFPEIRSNMDSFVGYQNSKTENEKQSTKLE